MFICAELINDECVRWSEFSSFLPVLEQGQGMEMGWLFLGITAVAWGAKEIAILILNRR